MTENGIFSKTAITGALNAVQSAKDRKIIDEQKVRNTISIMKPDGQLFEVRLFSSDGKTTYSGYFRDADQLMQAFNRDIRDYAGCTVTMSLNRINDACFDRKQKNKFIRNARPNTGDKDITGYDWLMIDLDPDRPAETSSTDEQVEAAAERGNRVYSFLRELGFSDPLAAFSGNGVHLLYKVDLDNDKGKSNQRLVEKCLKTLSVLFTDEVIKVDTANSNPSRMCKLYGTRAQKGSDSPERPHRMSSCYTVGDAQEIKVNSSDLLKKLCSYYPETEADQRSAGVGSAAKFNIEDWLFSHGIHYKASAYDGGTKYVLDQCPFDANHKSPDSAIFRGSNGAIGFRCLHNSCSDKRWRDVRQMLEPDAYDNKKIQYKPKSQDKNAATSDKKPKKVSLVCLDDVEEQEVSWLYRPYFPKGKITLCAAYPGSGKTYMMCNVAARVSQGEPLFDYIPLESGKPGKVIYLTSEDGIADTIKQRLRVCGANMKNIFTVESGTTLLFDSPEIEQIMNECRPDLMIFDPMQSYLGADIDMNRANETREKLNNLVTLAGKYNTSVVAVCHFNKNQKGTAITRVLGSTDITGICRSYIAIGDIANEPGAKYMAHEKSSLSERGKTVVFEIDPNRGGIVFEGTSDLSMDDYEALRAKKRFENAPAIEAAKQFIIDQMPDGWRPAKEIQTLARAQHISDRTLARARKELGVITQKTKEFHAKTIWALPGHEDEIEPKQATMNFAE